MFNIITPTYNRAHTLERVLNSLLQQTYVDFKWIIVDDCSTDNTTTLVENWKKTYLNLNIEYYKLEKNQGKSMAVNFGLNKCTFPYTMIADSDDSFERCTLNDLARIWEAIELTTERTKISCIWTLVKDEKGNLVGEKFPKDFWQVNFNERILKNDVKGEKWHCWRTLILRERPMVLGDNCHVPESTTWNAINRNYDFLCVNIIHRVYYNSVESLINTKVDKYKSARSYFYGSYPELKIASVSEIISYNYYRNLAFNFIKSKFYVSNKKMKLSFMKILVMYVLFILEVPKRILIKIK